MTFTENDKLKALGIVNIFETSRPFGDYSAVAVLDDGAGVSYGISQFTHRSGALAEVVERYLNAGGQIGRAILTNAMPLLRRKSAVAIKKLAADASFKKALGAAAITREMKEAQEAVAFERYLGPAIGICAERGFALPLSLAVVYDSLTHGSWERIAARVTPGLGETAWITEYVRKRHLWLTNIRRLNATNYRTKFFLDQIAISNWELRLPVTVHGVRLLSVAAAPRESAAATGVLPEEKSDLEKAGEIASSTADKFDRVDAAVTGVVTRTDRAKSLWTTVGGTFWQAVWAVFGFLVGLPREVWIVVAIIAAALMLGYLYRQIVLGRIREVNNSDHTARLTNHY